MPELRFRLASSSIHYLINDLDDRLCVCALASKVGKESGFIYTQNTSVSLQEGG